MSELPKQFLFSLALCLAICFAASSHARQTLADNSVKIYSPFTAYQNKQNKIWIAGSGSVVKLLPDDTRGIRHQRFLVRIAPSVTLLLAHNIDTAPKLADLQMGDLVEFQGEYIYHKKGGIVHWTHRHRLSGQGGWIKHNGKIYQ